MCLFSFEANQKVLLHDVRQASCIFEAPSTWNFPWLPPPYDALFAWH
jgi:hypothetical protein